MAYNAKNLSVLAYANGFTLWHYTAKHGVADMMQPGYFNAAADMLRAGDQVFVTGAEMATLGVAQSGWNTGFVRVALLTQVVAIGGAE